MIRRESQKKDQIPHRIMQLRWELAFSKSDKRKKDIENELKEYDKQALVQTITMDED